jgi:hypothetical protein
LHEFYLCVITLKLPVILYLIKLGFQNHSKICLVPGCSAIYNYRSIFLRANRKNHAIKAITTHCITRYWSSNYDNSIMRKHSFSNYYVILLLLDYFGIQEYLSFVIVPQPPTQINANSISTSLIYSYILNFWGVEMTYYERICYVDICL